MKIIIIVAMTRDRLIGKDGGMPWHEPADLKHFKRTTKGHAVIMGRRTFESLGKPLPGRRNIVITRNPNHGIAPQGNASDSTSLDVVHSLEEALGLCRQRDAEKAFVIGGAQIYALALPVADEMIVTYVDRNDVSGDTWFPRWEAEAWLAATAKTDGSLSVVHYTRANKHTA